MTVKKVRHETVNLAFTYSFTSVDKQERKDSKSPYAFKDADAQEVGTTTTERAFTSKKKKVKKTK